MPEADSIATNTAPFYLWEPCSLQPADTEAPAFALDSLFMPLTETDTVYRPSMFTHHSLTAVQSDLQLRERHETPAWMFVTILLLSALLILYYRLHKVKLPTLFQSVLDKRVMDRMLRGNNLGRRLPLAPMGLLAVAALCVAMHWSAMQHTGWLGWLALTAGVMLVYLLRNGVLRLLASVFEQEQAMNTYITSNYLFHLILATLLVPLLFPLVYLPAGNNTVMIIGIVVCVIEFIVRFLRGAKLFLTQTKGSSLFLFYYLCTVELIPVFALVKWFIGQ